MPSQKDLLGRRFVLSGPIGSGKSTVGELLRRRGAMVVEADRIGHAVLEPDGEAHAAVAARWPDVVREGRIDRAALAARVFANGEALAELERLTHPHIARRIVAAVTGAADAVVVVELPLTADLLGPGWHRVVVIAADDLRVERAVAKGMDRDDVLRRMASQPPLDVWEASADSVIVNEGDRAALDAQVAAWWERHVA